MSKHRRAPSAAVPPTPRPARDAVIWGCFGCALVPVVLLWSGASWRVAFGVGGLVLLLALGCGLALHFSGLTLPSLADGTTSAHRVSAMTDRNDRLVWIDCEMTGLDLGHDALVEVAALVTDTELTVLGEGVDVVIRPPEESLDQMLDVVRTMHTTSGLLDELATGTTMAEAEEMVLGYIREHVPTPRKAPLAGNTVFVDRGFLARDMPALEAHMHYRIVDVSSIKELVRRWYPRVYFNSPVKSGGHRALSDIRESIEELKFYRQAIFVPQPGPDSEASRALAAQFTLAPSAEVEG